MSVPTMESTEERESAVFERDRDRDRDIRLESAPINASMNALFRL